MLDSAVLAMMVSGGQDSSVAPEGIQGRVRDSREHHSCHKGHSCVPAPGSEDWALRQPLTADLPKQPKSELKYLKSWGVLPGVTVLQGVGQYLWASPCILIRKSLFSHCNDWQSPTKWHWSHFSLLQNILRNAALQKKIILVSHSEIFLFFKISQPGNTGQVSGAAGTWAPAWLPGHPSPTPHFQSFSNFSLASLLVSLLNHFNSTKWSLCYCPYLLSMSSGSPMLSLLSETSFYCCQHCSVAVPAEQQAAGSALPSSSSRKLPLAIWFPNICLAVFLIGAIKEMLEKKNNKNRTRYTVQKKKKWYYLFTILLCNNNNN